MPEEKSMLAEQFADAEQQSEASQLGMWTFLATEVLFFGGLFVAYILYRHLYPEAFAIGSRHTDLLYGTLNTAILLTSSLTHQRWLFMQHGTTKQNPPSRCHYY